MYCTGKASGWFFRHEISDLFIERTPQKQGHLYIWTLCHAQICFLYVHLPSLLPPPPSLPPSLLPPPPSPLPPSLPPPPSPLPPPPPLPLPLLGHLLLPEASSIALRQSLWQLMEEGDRRETLNQQLVTALATSR